MKVTADGQIGDEQGVQGRLGNQAIEQQRQISARE